MFAKIFEFSVTAISQSDVKAEDTFQMGASRFVSKSHTRNIADTLDILIVTSRSTPDLDMNPPWIAERGNIVLASFEERKITIAQQLWMRKGVQIIPSAECSVSNREEILQLVARRQMKPWIQTYDMSSSGLEDALAALQTGRVRYRAVLYHPGEI